ncbi:hypothetical protein B0H21DRAFT_676936, partial [Amylocystis lapponica]
KWARLRLPNGQVARTAWKEKRKPLHKLRISRNVKFKLAGNVHFGEVLFYVYLDIPHPQHGTEEKALALVSIYTQPHPALLQASLHTVLSCQYQGDCALCFIEVKAIESVVAMVPHNPFPGDPMERFVVVEKPGLDI